MHIVFYCKSPVLMEGIKATIEKYFFEQLVILDTLSTHNENLFDRIDTISFTSDMSTIFNLTVLKSVYNYPDIIRVYYDEMSSTETLMLCLQKGLNGYLSHDSSVQEVIDCISLVRNGKKFFDNKVLMDLILKDQAQKAENKSEVELKLTPAELKVANFLTSGFKVSEIARKMGKNISTVSTVKSHIFKKLNIDNVISLVDIMRLNHF